jgi:hypothetical protein
MQTPTRITIELEPSGERRGGWRARTSVDGRRTETVRVNLRAAPEAADVDWTPTPYEPGPCTCEDGLCHRDHEHE